MEARLQRRVQRYGWDLAAAEYEALWQAQLAGAQAQLLACAAPAPGERVLDVASGTGLVAFAAAAAVGAEGSVVGVDLSGHMVDMAALRARERNLANVRFERMDAENLALPDASFDVALCAFGLMYLPDPGRALREMRRVLRSGGRLAVAIWGERARCGWASMFSIIDSEVKSEACPLFFRLGQSDALAQLCEVEGFTVTAQERHASTLDYADSEAACRAAFVGGPGALAWSRFDEATRARVCKRYVESIWSWRDERGYRVPGEIVIVTASLP